MNSINIEQVSVLAEVFKQEDHMDQLFKKFQAKYKSYFHYDQPTNVLQKVTKINQKASHKNQNTDLESSSQKFESFAFGQLKVFTWVLTVYCHQKKLLLEQIDEVHLKEVQNIFPNKSITFIRYEIMCLAHQKVKFALEWSQPQIDMLTKIVKQKQNLCEWRHISYQLFCNSQGKFYRPFQQCRQKWFNHLDPNVRKGKWTIEEDISLLAAVQFLDCKWIEICRVLGGVRTEHMIKNRYKSLMKKWKKKYEKTSPTKIVSLVLKHLKTKLKKGDLNSSMSSNQHEEEPIPIKPKKEKPHNNFDKLESVSISRSNQISPEEGVSFGFSSSGNSSLGPSFKNLPRVQPNNQSSEFDLGLGSSFNWRSKVEHESESLEERVQNAMVSREDQYSNQAKNKQERKTADSDELPEDNYESNPQNFYSQLDQIGQIESFNNNELFEVEGFQYLNNMRMKIIEPPNDNDWPYWDDKMNMNSFDLSDY